MGFALFLAATALLSPLPTSRRAHVQMMVKVPKQQNLQVALRTPRTQDCASALLSCVPLAGLGGAADSSNKRLHQRTAALRSRVRLTLS